MKKGIFEVFVILTFFIFSCSNVSVGSSEEGSNDQDKSGNTDSSQKVDGNGSDTPDDTPEKDDKNDPAPECVSTLDCRVNFICVDGTCVESDDSGEMGNAPLDLCRKLCEQEILCYWDEYEPGEEKEELAECIEYCSESIKEDLEEANEISKQCGKAYENLLKCIAELDCDEVEEYWDGEPFEDSYPCDSIEEQMITECDWDEWEDDWDEWED